MYFIFCLNVQQYKLTDQAMNYQQTTLNKRYIIKKIIISIKQIKNNWLTSSEDSFIYGILHDMIQKLGNKRFILLTKENICLLFFVFCFCFCFCFLFCFFVFFCLFVFLLFFLIFLYKEEVKICCYCIRNQVKICIRVIVPCQYESKE